MKIKVALAYIIILSIPLAGMYSQIVIHRHCDEVLACVQLAIEQTDDNPTPENVTKALQLWKKSEGLLTTFVTHEEVDAVSICLSRAKALLQIGDFDEYYETLNESIVSINIVRNFDKPTIRSIL